jgi:hypothetical protein
VFGLEGPTLGGLGQRGLQRGLVGQGRLARTLRGQAGHKTGDAVEAGHLAVVHQGVQPGRGGFGALQQGLGVGCLHHHQGAVVAAAHFPAQGGFQFQLGFGHGTQRRQLGRPQRVRVSNTPTASAPSTIHITLVRGSTRTITRANWPSGRRRPWPCVRHRASTPASASGW